MDWNNNEQNNYAGNNNIPNNRVELSEAQFEQLLKRQRANGRGQGVLITIAALAAIILIGCSIFFVTKHVLSGNRISSNASQLTNNDVKVKIESLWSVVEKEFLWDEDIDVENAKNYIFKGIMASLGDPYTIYYTKDEYKELLQSFEGEYSGIGAYVSQSTTTGETYISKPMKGSPAEEAGLLPDDVICEVDGENIEGKDLNVIVSKIKGPEGTTVDLGIYRKGNPDMIVFTVERRTIEVDMAEGRMLDDEIGYILISEVEGALLKQFDRIYSDLESQGMKGLILDLRDNPGGDLNAVVDLADKFLDEGIVVYTEDKYGNIQEYKSDAECIEIPMVVLVNANTASAAEILSGSLKERGVATIVGTNTFGKGIVQSIIPLTDGSAIKITESEYFLEHDTKIHQIGVIPDVVIELDKEAYKENKSDNQLDKAISIMKDKLK